MPVIHAFSSSKADGADSSQVQPSNWNANHAVTGIAQSGTVLFTSGGLITGSANMFYDESSNHFEIFGTKPGICLGPTVFSESISAEAGEGIIFNKRKAGRMLLNFMGASGLDYSTQPMIGMNRIQIWQASGQGTNITQWGAGNWTTSGTATTAGNFSVANFSSSLKRLNYVGAAGAGNGGAVFGTSSFARGVTGATAGAGGGFFYVARLVLDSNTMAMSGTRLSVGMRGAITSIGNADPSSVTNIIAVGADANDTTYQFMTNDGTSTATKTNTAISRSQGDVVEVRVFAPPSGSFVGMSVEVVSGSDGSTKGVAELVYSGSDMPSQSTVLAPYAWFTNGATGVAVRLGVISTYVETDW